MGAVQLTGCLRAQSSYRTQPRDQRSLQRHTHTHSPVIDAAVSVDQGGLL